jgi:hypothetical protein
VRQAVSLIVPPPLSLQSLAGPHAADGISTAMSVLAITRIKLSMALLVTDWPLATNADNSSDVGGVPSTRRRMNAWSICCSCRKYPAKTACRDISFCHIDPPQPPPPPLPTKWSTAALTCDLGLKQNTLTTVQRDPTKTLVNASSERPKRLDTAAKKRKPRPK